MPVSPVRELFPPEVSNEVIDKVKGKSSLARLSKAEPMPFNGVELFTFDFDNEASFVGENAAKVPGGTTVGTVTMRPYKVEYSARYSDEFMFASREYQLDVLRRHSEGFSKKLARALDIGAFHGINPRSRSASTVIGDNHFDHDVSQTVTLTNDPSADVESAIALVHGNELDVTGMAMSPAFRSALAALMNPQTAEPRFPELGWGAQPGVLRGLPVDTNSTVSFNSNLDRAIIGDFENCFRWGFAKQMFMRVFDTGNPDNDANAGDLAGHNQVLIRTEAYIGWGILLPTAFSRIVASST